MGSRVESCSLEFGGVFRGLVRGERECASWGVKSFMGSVVRFACVVELAVVRSA